MQKSTLLSVGLLFAFAKSETLLAKPTDPSASAGILERQVQQEYNIKDLSPEREVPLLEIDIPEKKFNIPKGASAFIETINLEGNTILSKKEVDSILAPYLNRELTGDDVIKLSLEFDQHYAKKGYILAWTYPPVQVIKDNTLVLKVLEGHLEDIEIEGNTSYSTRFIKRFFASQKGNPVNYNTLLKSILLLSENQDLALRAVLKKGKEKGGVTLLVLIEDKRPLGFSAGYNNWGAKVTTYNQLSTRGYIGNLFTSGDNLTMMTSFGVPPNFYYLNPVYNIPLTGSGTTLTLSYSYSFSYIQSFKELNLTGWSETGTIGVKQPLARTRQFDADAYCSFDIKQVKNLEDGKTTSYDKLRVLNAGFSCDYSDSVQGRTIFNTIFHVGIPDFLGGSQAVIPDEKLPSREGAGARYYIMNIHLQRIQNLPKDFGISFISAAQGTFNKLPIPEQFYLGGIGTVRGYPSAVAVGDIGYYGNLEFFVPPPFFKDKMVKSLGVPWKDALKFLAFVDHGGLYTNTDVFLEESPAYLTAAGAGLRFYGPRDLNISFDVAFPLTNQYKGKSPFYYVRINMSLY